MSTEQLSFKNQVGQELSARLIRPLTGEVRAYALFAHCFTCTKNLAATRNIARALAGTGVATLIFDFTGLGGSGGEFADTNFSSNIGDLVAAADFLEQHFEAPKILAGHSLGGTAALMAATQIPSVVAVASIGSPADPVHVAHLVKSKRKEIEINGKAEVSLGGQAFFIKKQFLDDLEQHPVLDVVAHFKKALLVMHAPLDATVDIANATQIFTAAKHPKSFVSLDKADHLLSNKADSEYAGQVIATWASRYLDEDNRPSPYPNADQHDAAARTRIEGFKTHVTAGQHPLIADEPVSAGGTGLGPAPFDLLAAALATCTTMTLRMYAGRKELPMESATCFVQHRKEPDAANPDRKIEVFERQLELDGDLTAPQRQRMLEIANMCPVHRALTNKIEIRTVLSDADRA